MAAAGDVVGRDCAPLLAWYVDQAEGQFDLGVGPIASVGSVPRSSRVISSGSGGSHGLGGAAMPDCSARRADSLDQRGEVGWHADVVIVSFDKPRRCRPAERLPGQRSDGDGRTVTAGADAATDPRRLERDERGVAQPRVGPARGRLGDLGRVRTLDHVLAVAARP